MNIIDLDSLQSHFVSGLFFSIIEGLKPGQAIEFTASFDLDEILQDVRRAGPKGVHYDVKSISQTFWRVKVVKCPKEHYQDHPELIKTAK